MKDLPAGWSRLNDEDSEIFSKEFYREADKSHELFYDRLWAVARCEGFDDVLFKVHDGRYAVIHLTWSIETSPNFPAFELFETFREWKQEMDKRAIL